MFGQFGCMPLWQTTCQGLRTIHGGGGGCCSLNNKCCEGLCPVFPWNPCRPNPCGTPAICCKPCKFLPPLQPTPPGFATTLHEAKLAKRRKRRKKRGEIKQVNDIKLEYRRGAEYHLPPRAPCPGKGRMHMGHANLGGLCPTHFAQFRGMGRGMMGRGMMGPFGAGFGMGYYGMGPFGEAMGRGMYGPGMGAGMMGQGMGPWMGRGPGSMMGRGMDPGAMGPGGQFRPGTPGAEQWRGKSGSTTFLQPGQKRSKSMTRISQTKITVSRPSRTDIGRPSRVRIDASPSKTGLGRPTRSALGVDRPPSKSMMGARPTMSPSKSMMSSRPTLSPSKSMMPGRSMSPGLTPSKSMLGPSLGGPSAARPSYMFPPRPSASRSMAYPRDTRFGSAMGRPSTGGLPGTYPSASFSGQSFMGGRPSVPRPTSIFSGSTMFPSIAPPIPPMGIRPSYLEKDKTSDESVTEKPSGEEKDAYGRPGVTFAEGPWGWPPAPPPAPAPDPRFMWPCTPPPPTAVAPPPPWAGAGMGGFPSFSAGVPCGARPPCSTGGRRQRSHSAVEPRPIGSICALCPCARHHVSKAVSAIVALSLIAANHATGGLCSCPTHTLPPGATPQFAPAPPMYPSPVVGVGGQGIHAGVNALRLTRSEVAVRCRM